MSFVLWILAVILVIIGVVGIVVPVLPGVVFVFVGLFLAAWADGFQAIGWVTISVLAGLMVLALLADALATKRSASSARGRVPGPSSDR